MRIEDAHLKRNEQILLEEQKNVGHENWEPLNNPDWLLLEIDANILIRRDQVEVALATINPFTSANSVLQMNMGQGRIASLTVAQKAGDRADPNLYRQNFDDNSNGCYSIGRQEEAPARRCP